MVVAALHPLTQLGTGFSVHPSTVIGIAALGALYAWRASRVDPREEELPPTSGQRIAFVSGLVLMFFSLNGPLHDLSDSYLFTAHMVQHLLLTMLVIPLLIVGTPGWMLRPALEWPRIGRAARWATRGTIAFTIFNVTMIVWHLPPMYNLALAVHPIHIVQHLCLLVAATLMWWPLMGTLPELPRLSYPGQMLYSVLMAVPMSAISVCITYADTLLYPAYANAPRIVSLSPLEDQRLGGLIMWIPGGLIFGVVLSIVFYKWAAHDVDKRPEWRPGPL